MTTPSRATGAVLLACTIVFLFGFVSPQWVSFRKSEETRFDLGPWFALKNEFKTRTWASLEDENHVRIAPAVKDARVLLLIAGVVGLVGLVAGAATGLRRRPWRAGAWLVGAALLAAVVFLWVGHAVGMSIRHAGFLAVAALLVGTVALARARAPRAQYPCRGCRRELAWVPQYACWWCGQCGWIR